MRPCKQVDHGRAGRQGRGMGLTRHMRMLEAGPGIVAWYDGRVPGHRFADFDNWVDDGALSLGIASYAVISGDEALVYDTQVSVPHAEVVCADLRARGVTRVRVVLSHWHLDHVAGTAAFARAYPGVEVIANRRTLAHLTERQTAIEAGTDHGPPAIAPLVLPDVVFSGEMRLRVGVAACHLDRGEHSFRRCHGAVVARGPHPAGGRHGRGLCDLCRCPSGFRRASGRSGPVWRRWARGPFCPVTAIRR